MEYFETILRSFFVLFQKIWNFARNGDLFAQNRLALFPFTKFKIRLSQSEYEMTMTPEAQGLQLKLMRNQCYNLKFGPWEH